jgi:hypothetical protein
MFFMGRRHNVAVAKSPVLSVADQPYQMNYVIIDGLFYLKVGRCTWLKIATEEEVAQATLDSFARLVQFRLAEDSYYSIQSSKKFQLH